MNEGKKAVSCAANTALLKLRSAEQRAKQDKTGGPALRSAEHVVVGNAPRNEAWKYIRKIRNVEKKSFARKAYDHIFNDAPEPEWSNYNCGYMAKQSVCIHLRNIFDAELV